MVDDHGDRPAVDVSEIEAVTDAWEGDFSDVATSEARPCWRGQRHSKVLQRQFGWRSHATEAWRAKNGREAPAPGGGAVSLDVGATGAVVEGEVPATAPVVPALPQPPCRGLSAALARSGAERGELRGCPTAER